MNNSSIKNVIKKYWVVIWLIAAFSICFGFIVYAAYPRVTTVKRVVTTQEGIGTLFSSNYLLEEHDINTFRYRPVPIPESEINDDTVYVTETLRISNFPQGILTAHYPENIPFTLSAILVDMNGSPLRTAPTNLEHYKLGTKGFTAVETNSGIEYQCNYDEQVLSIDKLGGRDTKEYEIRFPVEQVNSPTVYIQIIAKPTKLATTQSDLAYLTGRLGVALAEITVDQNWTGSLVEAASVKTPSAYDGYNYEFTGAGKGTVTLMWDDSIFELSAHYEENENLNNAESGEVDEGEIHAGWKYISFKVGEAESDGSVKGRYAFQLYRSMSSTINWNTIDFESLSEFVDYSFTKPKSNVDEE